jgi:hypothetical protein
MAKAQVSRRNRSKRCYVFNRDVLQEKRRQKYVENKEYYKKKKDAWYKKFGLTSNKKYKEYIERRDFIMSLSAEELLAFVRMDNK